MKKGIGIAVGIMLVSALSSPALAKQNGKGGESQKGGLPALENRVEADEALIAALQAQVLALQGQNNWAVVNAAGVVQRFSSGAGAVTAEHVATGQYEVIFNRDVSGCAYEATIGDAGTSVPAQGQISVSGDADTDSNHDVFVQTFDPSGLIATDSPFHLTVSCP